MRRRHLGPLLVQRPFYPEPDGTCHSYILHPPGGVAAGDSLDLRVALEPGARCLLTAPGATKFYRTPDGEGRQRFCFDVADGAVCENLPMESILFDGASVRTETEIRLSGNAVYMGWELVSLGRPAAAERYASGRFAQRVSITRDGRPVWFERTAIEGGSPLLEAAHGLRGEPIFGVALYAGALPPDAADMVRARISPPVRGHGAVTRLDSMLVCRFAGSRVTDGRAFFVEAWDALRRLGLGKPAAAPRIWAT